MPTIVHNYKRQRNFLDVYKWLNYLVIGAIVFLIVLLSSSSGTPPKGNSGTRVKTVQEQTKPYYPDDEKYNPVVPMDDDFYAVKDQAYLDDMVTPDDDYIGPNGKASSDRQKKNSTLISLQPFDPSTSFVDEYCDLTNVDSWWPSGHDWRTRAPYFLLIGSKKSGTTSLSMWLSQHPLIVPPRVKELLYFLPRRFERTNEFTNKIQVDAARQDMYETDYKVDRLKDDESRISYEATPGYILFSTLSRIPILCTMPWVKLLVVVRNPVDRIFSNYNFLMDAMIKQRERSGLPTTKNSGWTNPMPSLDEFIKADIEQLRRAGVLRHDADESFFGSDEERRAWTTYQSMMGTSEGPVGRSLYVLQLQEWYAGLSELGRDPTTDVLVVRNEEMHDMPDVVYQKVLWWLELPAFTPNTYTSSMVTTYRSEPMSEETKQMLQELLRPYNKRLYKLLGWEDDLWEQTPAQKKEKEAEQKEDEIEDEMDEEEEVAMRETLNSTEIAHLYDPPDYDEARGLNFTERWCILDKTSWYPPPHGIWQLRAPYFILPGAKKSGTTSLASYIMQHPFVARARTKELQFFLNKNFRTTYVTDDRKTKVAEARQHLYDMEYDSGSLRHNASLISMDATPGYLFFSAMLPQRILCVTPWIKLVIILRDPVDRAYSNWAYALRRNGNIDPERATFERVMDSDLKILKESGFLDAKGAVEEEQTWEKYLGMATEGILGRSLYEIQLRQWFQALRDVGRDPATQVHIVRSEDLKVDVQGEMKKVYTFLGLPYVPVQYEDEKVVSHYAAPMKNETREQLEKLFAPYNEKLYDLLVDLGFGDEWRGFWKPRIP